METNRDIYFQDTIQKEQLKKYKDADRLVITVFQ
jgi:hypothetical protein